MNKQEKFFKSQMSSEEEKSFLNKNMTVIVEKQLKKRYAETLEKQHGVTRVQGSNKGKSTNSKIRILSIISSVAAMFVLALFIWPNSNSPIQLSNNFIQKDFYENKSIKRGGVNSDLIRSEAVLAYNDKNFTKAISKYKLLDVATNEDNFFLAMSFLYNKDYNPAALQFEELLLLKGFKYEEEVKWFASLAFINNNQIEKARLTLNEINLWKKSDAQTLLESIK